jgi:putative sterol carrier protein
MTAQEFLESLPAKVNPDALNGVETTFHFNLDGGGLQKTVDVKDGKIHLSDGLNGDPKCVVSAKSETLMKLVKGEENPMMAVMMGKVKISNTGEMLKYAKLFGIM